ncbi:hypothetical protein [Nocardia sp. NPDC052566]|uniref:hypothetical protein n=1 Tax=Nocardia sp. NPDC052566 TaxID=3364330 RepID=UPI0037C6FFEA
MTRIGIWLAIFGFGSLLLNTINYHFIILAWADDMQPVFGIALGVVGVLVAIAGVVMGQAKNTPTG